MLFNEIFYKLAIVSFKASFLIVAIIFVKYLFSTKIGAKAQYYLWFLLLIKLSLVTSIINIDLLNIFNRLAEGISISNKEYSYMPNEIINWFNGTIDNYQLDSVKGSSSTLQQLIINIIPIIWAIVSFILLLYIVKSNIEFKNRIKKNMSAVNSNVENILDECKGRLNININIKLHKSNLVVSPCIYSLFEPCILIPEHLEDGIDSNELKYILTHELAHYKRKDIFIFYIITLFKIIYWFNPLIWYGLYRMKQDCEVACDALALSSFKENENVNYGLSLIHVMEKNLLRSNNLIVAKFSNSKKHTKRRIEMIKLFKKDSYKITFTSIAIFLVMGVVFLTNTNTNAQDNKNAINIQKQENIVPNKATDNIAQNKEITLAWPVPSSDIVISTFGKRVNPLTKEEFMHTGIDIHAKKGEIITCAENGKVIFAGEKNMYGKVVIISHSNGFASMYAHCSEIMAKEGDTVKKNQNIAKVGSTGASTGPHLHFELRKDEKPVDPLKYVVK
jgi:bla regulator protein BlaR1